MTGYIYFFDEISRNGQLIIHHLYYSMACVLKWCAQIIWKPIWKVFHLKILSSYFELVQCKTTNFDINIFWKWYTIKLVAWEHDATQQIYWLSDRNVHTPWHIYPHEYTNCIFSFFFWKTLSFHFITWSNTVPFSTCCKSKSLQSKDIPMKKIN